MMQQCKNLHYTRPIISVGVVIIIIFVILTTLKSGAGLAGMRDSMVQIRDIPGNLRQVGTLLKKSACIQKLPAPVIME